MTITDECTPARPAAADDGRAVGTARTPAERIVEDALAAVPQWRGRSLYYAPVTGGLQNSNWRITVSDCETRYFLKIPGAGSEAFIDRTVANKMGRRAGGLGIGPRVVHFDPASGIEIIEFLQGYRACTNGDLKRADIPSQIMALYRTLHGSGPLGRVKTIFDMIDEHLDQVSSLGVRLPTEWPVIEAEYRAAKGAMLAGGLDLVACHNDPMPGNFLYREDGPLKLIDYEFASDNDRAYELGIFTTEMFFDDRRVHEIVEEYYGRLDFATLARVHVCGTLSDVKWGLWGCVNHRLSTTWDFDYHKYGTWKLMRARLKISDPRWGLWLATL